VQARYVLAEDDGDLRIPCADVFTGPAGEALWLRGCAPPEDVLSVTEWVPAALGAGLVDLRLPPLHDRWARPGERSGTCGPRAVHR
jgi:hypothetical protein